MYINSILYSFKPAQRFLIDRRLDTTLDQFLIKIDEIESKFVYNLYCQILNCVKADIQELYNEIFSNKLLQKKVTLKTDMEHITSLFKWFSCYNVVKFLSKENANESIDFQEVIFSMFELFEFTQLEKIKFEEMLSENSSCDTFFEIAFTNHIIENVLSVQNANSSVTLAFFNNFFYNSFESFIKSFTNYVSLDSKLYEV